MHFTRTSTHISRLSTTVKHDNSVDDGISNRITDMFFIFIFLLVRNHISIVFRVRARETIRIVLSSEELPTDQTVTVEVYDRKRPRLALKTSQQTPIYQVRFRRFRPVFYHTITCNYEVRVRHRVFPVVRPICLSGNQNLIEHRRRHRERVFSNVLFAPSHVQFFLSALPYAWPSSPLPPTPSSSDAVPSTVTDKLK